MRKNNIYLGLILILTALLIIFSQFGLFPGIGIFDIIVTVFMLVIITLSIIRINFWGIFFPLAVILIIYDGELGITEFAPWPVLLSAFFLSLGLSLIFNKDYFVRIDRPEHFGKGTIDEVNGNTINCTTVFGDCIKYVNTENFERAAIKTVFGDVKIYFDNAKIPSNKADIFIDVVFGDVDLYVPKNWNIQNNTHAIFGDFDMTHNELTPDSPIVTLYGNIVFGDVKLIFV